MLFITDLNIVSLIEMFLTAAILHMSSASVILERWQNLSKPTNQRVFQILVYPEWPFVKFAQRHSFTSSRHTFYFLYAVFHAAFQLTERLEEATPYEAPLINVNEVWSCTK